jgi:hypothetical protein
MGNAGCTTCIPKESIIFECLRLKPYQTNRSLLTYFPHIRNTISRHTFTVIF